MPSKRVLVIRADLAAIEVAKDIVSDVCDRKGLLPEVFYERNLADARRRLGCRHGYDLVIVNADIPESRSDSVGVGDDRRLGVRAIEELREAGDRTPAILIGTVSDEQLARTVKRVKPASLTLEGNEFGDELEKQVRCWLADEAACGARLDVEIYLGDDRTKCWYKLRGRGGIAIEDEGALRIDDRLLEQLVDDSRVVGQIETKWETQFRRVGNELAKSIFVNNPDFDRAFAHAQGYMRATTSGGQGDPKMRIRFVVETKVHPIALEAIVDERKRYWMLRAPIFRRLRVGVAGTPFVKGTTEEPVNCLIIEADAHGYVESIQKQIAPLGHVAREAQQLEDLLETKKSQGRAIGKVRRFPRDRVEAGGTDSFQQELKRIMEGDSWHFVHFVGHSMYDEAQRQGYIVVPGRRGGAETVSSARFAEWLRHTHFVYLSSCESSEEDFVYEMANAQVPAVAGFRWKIDDAVAPEYAMKFYGHLFDNEHEVSLEDAFLLARRDLHESHRQHKVWAAPVLVIQTGD